MTRTRLIALAALCLSGAGVQAQAPQTTEFTVAGIKVIHKPITANDVISARLYLRGGSAASTPATSGIEQLIFTVATSGTEKYDKDAFSAKATATGTSVAGQATSDYSVATLQAVRQHWEDAWDLFTQAVLHPTFPESEVKLAREQAVFALKQRTDDPDSHLNMVSDSILYRGHPYAVDAQGTPASVQKLTRDDLVRWHKRRMTRANLLLVVVGNVSREDLTKKITAAFGSLPAAGGAAARVPALRTGGATIRVIEQKLPTNYVMGNFAAPERASRDYPALALATRLLSERLFEEVRTKRNLTYAVGAGYTAGQVGRGNLYVTAVEPDTTIKVIMAEVRRLQREPVPVDRLKETLNTFATSYWMSQETNMGQAQQLGHWELTGGGWRNARAYVDRLNAVTPADIRRVAAAYLKNAQFVVIGDPKKINRTLFTSM